MLVQDVLYLERLVAKVGTFRVIAWEVTAAVGTCVPLLAISQLTLLNAGLARASSLLIVPIFVATFVTCNAVGGGFVLTGLEPRPLLPPT